MLRCARFRHASGPAAKPLEQTTWDFQWLYACWQNQGLAIYPAVHLVENIGQGHGATHTQDTNLLFARPSERLVFPLSHPRKVEVDARLDREIFRTVFMGERPWAERVWHAVSRRLTSLS